MGIYPIAGWFTRENPWMMTGGSPLWLWKAHMRTMVSLLSLEKNRRCHPWRYWLILISPSFGCHLVVPPQIWMGPILPLTTSPIYHQQKPQWNWTNSKHQLSDSEVGIYWTRGSMFETHWVESQNTHGGRTYLQLWKSAILRYQPCHVPFASLLISHITADFEVYAGEFLTVIIIHHCFWYPLERASH